jgi:hypothetical protein
MQKWRELTSELYEKVPKGSSGQNNIMSIDYGIYVLQLLNKYGNIV